MSSQELHDLLVQLETEGKRFGVVDQEKRQRIDELVESLEQQQLYPQDHDQLTILKEQIHDLVLEYEVQHPSIASLLTGIGEVLRNFKV